MVQNVTRYGGICCFGRKSTKVSHPLSTKCRGKSFDDDDDDDERTEKRHWGKVNILTN